MPSQEQIMHRMLAGNPYGPPGSSPIGKAQGILFSDVRTSIALVLKEKNGRLFRPSIFPESPTEAQIHLLDNAQSLVKVSFISEEPLKSMDHAVFAIHAADAIADLAEGTLIYDRVAERLWERDELAGRLKRYPSGRDTELHVFTNWVDAPSGGWAETRGLPKVGVKDLRTVPMEHDERNLIQAILELAAENIWFNLGIPEELVVSLFDDRFQVELSKVGSKSASKGGARFGTSHGPEFNQVRVLRIPQ
jgi:hypothetical protein